MSMNRRERGTTLVELLVTISIMVVVLAPIITLVTLFLKTHSDVVEDNQLQHEARFIVEYLTNKVNEADSWNDLSWDSDQKLRLNGNVVFWYDVPLGREYGNRILKGDTVDSYEFSTHVHEDTTFTFGPNQLEIFLVLATHSGKRYELRTIIFKRAKRVEY